MREASGGPVLLALGEACEAVAWLLESWPADEDPGPCIRTDLARWQEIVAEHRAVAGEEV